MTSHEDMRKVEDKRDAEALKGIGRVAKGLSPAQTRAVKGATGNRMRQMLAANGGSN
jgi:hypothetical protein